MDKKELLPEQKIHEFLSYLKKENSDTYEIAKRVLGFIYRDVKKEFANIRKNYEDKKNSEEYIGVVEYARLDLYNNYINNENGILDLFINMCQNPDKRYLSRFSNGIDTFLTMSEEGLYSDYPIFQYTFNIYAMLKAYEVYSRKDCSDCENYYEFDAVVTDLENLFIKSEMKVDKSYSSYSRPQQQAFCAKRAIIDSLLELGKYKDLPDLRERLKNELNTINFSYDIGVYRNYESCVSELDKFYEIVEKYKYTSKRIEKETIELIESDLFKYMKDTVVFSNYYNRYETKNAVNYFAPVLVFGERYKFIKQQLPEVETNEFMQQDILDYIRKMDIDFFDSFNKEVLHEQDAFITLMKIAFDSDSYYELDSKLTDIIKASKLYKTNKEESLKIIDGLTTKKHKEVIDGTVVAYPDNSINKINKPKTIFERMVSLHKCLPYYPGTQEYENKLKPSYYSSVTLKSYIDFIHNAFNSRKTKELERLEQERIAKEQKEVEPVPEEPKKVKGLGSIFGARKNNQGK